MTDTTTPCAPTGKPKRRPRSEIQAEANAAFRARVAEQGGTVLDPWSGATAKHRTTCPDGHTCYPVPHKIQKGHRICLECPRPGSIEAWDRFRARVAELGGEVLDTTWSGNRAKYSVRCSEGHVNQIWPIGLYREGAGICRRCAGKCPEAAWEKFKARVEELGGTVLEASWKGGSEPHACLCPDGHRCTPQPNSVMGGQGLCRTCANLDPAVHWKEFRARAERLGGVVLEARWGGSNHDHSIRCPADHVTTVRPVVLRQGGRLCKECPSPRTIRAEIEFRDRVVELGGVVLETRWLGWDQGHIATCRDGHTCYPIPTNVRQGKWICELCAGRRWDDFYVVLDEVAGTVKFGVTSGDPRPRLADHARDGFDRVVRLHTGLLGDAAPELERNVIAALRDAREKPVRGREYYHVRALPLVLDLVDNHPAVRGLTAPR